MGVFVWVLNDAHTLHIYVYMHAWNICVFFCAWHVCVTECIAYCADACKKYMHACPSVGSALGCWVKEGRDGLFIFLYDTLLK